MTGAQEIFNFSLHLLHLFLTGNLHVDGLDIGNTQHAFLRRGQGNVNHIILVLSHRGLALGFQ